MTVDLNDREKKTKINHIIHASKEIVQSSQQFKRKAINRFSLFFLFALSLSLAQYRVKINNTAALEENKLVFRFFLNSVSLSSLKVDNDKSCGNFHSLNVPLWNQDDPVILIRSHVTVAHHCMA